MEVYEQLKQGLFFTEGKFRVHGVKPVKKQNNSTWVEVTMTEGHNREVRRLFARVGHKVMKLERIGYGPLRLGRLKLGDYRELDRDELAHLHSVLDRNQRIDPEIIEKGDLSRESKVRERKAPSREPKAELPTRTPVKKKLASRNQFSSEEGARSQAKRTAKSSGNSAAGKPAGKSTRKSAGSPYGTAARQPGERRPPHAVTGRKPAKRKPKPR